MPTLKQIYEERDEWVNQEYENSGSRRAGSASLFPRGDSNQITMELFAGESNIAKKQYEQFRGWPYVAIRSISQRIAGQSVMMARGNYNPRERAAWAFSQKQAAFKSMTGFEKATLPEWVKDARINELERITQHDLLDAIARPNPAMVQWQLITTTVNSIELTGVSYWMYGYGEGGKFEIWPLPTHWVTPIHKKGPFAEFSVRIPGSVSAAITVPAENMAVFSLPDPSSITGVISPLQTQILAVNTDQAIEKAQNVTFERGIFPGIVLKAGRITDKNHSNYGSRVLLNAEQRKQIFAAVFGAWQSVANFRDPLIVDGMIEDVDSFTTKPAEMDFLNSGKWTKSRILQAYGVNPIVLGEVEGANRAQAAVAEQLMVDNVLRPIIQLISQVMTVTIGKYFDPTGQLLIWIDPAASRDREQRLREFRDGLRYGSATVNDYRQEVLRLPPIPEGDILLMPSGAVLIPVNGGEVPEMEPVQGGEDKPETDTDEGDDGKSKRRLRRRSKQASTRVVSHQFIADVYAEQLSTVSFKDDLVRIHREASTAYFQESSTDEAIFDAVEMSVRFAIGNVVSQGAAAERWIGTGKAEVSAEAFSRVMQHSKEAAASVMARIRPHVTGVDRGNQNSLNKSISDFNKIAGSIVKNSVGELLNAGRLAEIESRGGKKRWISQCGPRSRHCGMDGKTIESRDVFIVGDSWGLYPMARTLSAAHREGCQCVITGVYE